MGNTKKLTSIHEKMVRIKKTNTHGKAIKIENILLSFLPCRGHKRIPGRQTTAANRPNQTDFSCFRPFNLFFPFIVSFLSFQLNVSFPFIASFLSFRLFLSMRYFCSVRCFFPLVSTHRIIWHASSRGVASNNLELENAKGIPGEPDKKLKESKQKLQNARKIQSYSA